MEGTEAPATLSQPKHVHHPGTDFLTSPGQQEALLEMVRHGVPVGTAFRKLGRAPDIGRWKQAVETGHWRNSTGGGPVRPETLAAIKAFFAELDKAKAEGEAYLVESIYSAVGQVNEKTGMTDIYPAKFLLTHGPARENWHEHRPETTQTVIVSHVGAEHKEVRELPTADLIEDPEWAKLLPGGAE